jgi:hypothetical protein
LSGQTADLDSNEFYPNPDGPIANHTGSNIIVVTNNVKGGKRIVKIMRYLDKTWVCILPITIRYDFVVRKFMTL